LVFCYVLAATLIQLGVVHKRRPQSGGLSSADIMRPREEWVLQMRTSALFGAKSVVGQGGGVNFSWFCADVFYGRTLKCFYLSTFLPAIYRNRWQSLILKIW